MDLFDLPFDVLDIMEKSLSEESLWSLCLTCTKSLDWLQKRAYRKLYLEETEISGRSILAIASGPRASLVRHIQYSPNDPFAHTYKYPEEEGIELKLSAQSYDVLRSLGQFSNLDTFSFGPDWPIECWPEGASYFSDHTISETEPWRVVLDESFRALSESHGAFTRFEVSSLPPIVYPVLSTDSWKAHSTHLTFLNIKLAEIPDDGDWGGLNRCINDHIPSLNSGLLAYLPNLEHLRLAGAEGGVIRGYRTGPIHWMERNLLKLKVLELEWACLNDYLIDFIKHNATQLERIRLINCFSESLWRWSVLFGHIEDSAPSQLVEFEATSQTPSIVRIYDDLSTDEIDWEDYDLKDVPDGYERRQFYPIEIDEYGALREGQNDSDDELDSSDLAENLSELQDLVKRNITAQKKEAN